MYPGQPYGSENIRGIGYPPFYGDQFEGDVMITGVFSVEMLVVNIVVYFLLAYCLIWVWRRVFKRAKGVE
jgi:hypothetical protein